MKAFIVFTCLVSSTYVMAADVAIVKVLKGDVKVLTLGKTKALQVNEWVSDGAVIATGPRSFARLVFTDKSQMNIGPSAQMKIEQFSGKDSGVIDLVKGKIRSQVTKDYLQMDSSKSKLFIKTKNAVMGVRGTDFVISTNGINTSTILFEGEIAFNKLDRSQRHTTASLEAAVDQGVRLFPGEFSVMEKNRQIPTVPALLNVQQREKLEKNVDLEANRAPASASAENTKSIVPPGLSGSQVANTSETLKTEVSMVAKTISESASRDPNGYQKGELLKPANGSSVDLDSGAIIPPGPNAVLDTYSNTYIAGSEVGSVAADGSFVAGENTTISADGTVTVTTVSADGSVMKTEIAPVADTNTINAGTPVAPTPVQTTTTASGGLLYNDPTRFVSGSSGGSGTNGAGNFGTGTRFVIKP